MKLRNKILRFTLPLILIPLLLMALAVYYFVIRANRIQTEEAQKKNVNEAVLNIRKELEAARTDIRLLSNLASVKEYVTNPKDKTAETDLKNLLKLFFEKNPYYLKLTLADNRARELIDFDKFEDTNKFSVKETEDYFKRTLIAGNAETSVREFNRDQFGMILSTGVPIDEEVNGMIVLVLDVEVFKRSIRPLFERDLSSFLFDDRGILFASVLESNTERKLADELDLKNEASSLLSENTPNLSRKDTVLEGRTFEVSIFPADSFRLTRLAQSGGQTWFLGTIKEVQVETATRVFQFLFFVILASAVGAVFLFTSTAAKRVTDPLEKVNLATKQISKGVRNLELDIKTDDEVEELADAIKSMSVELDDYQKQLVQSAKLATIGEMASEISHELQNRISGMNMWLQYINSDKLTEEKRREYLREMRDGMDGFMDLLKTLKEYYKTPILNLSKVDFNELVKKAVALADKKVAEKDAEVFLNLANELPDVEIDEEKFKGVVLNLVLNAVDAIEKNGRVEISTSAYSENSDIRLTILDNGHGISDEDLARIFFPFYSTKPGGSGLGLAVSSNIIAAHNCKIEVESEFGRGTTFSISIPKARTF